MHAGSSGLTRFAQSQRIYRLIFFAPFKQIYAYFKKYVYRVLRHSISCMIIAFMVAMRSIVILVAACGDLGNGLTILNDF
jgi:hypothetical protein